MPKIKIIVVDRTRSPFLKQGESFYLERLNRYAQTEWVEVRPAGIKKGRPAEWIRIREGDLICKKIDTGDHIIALDRSGKVYDSVGLARRIEELSITGSCLTFVIGGPLGLSRETLAGSHEILSLSRLTLTHEMIRLLLLEQLYRAFTIIRGEKYHK
jgi:23S rRNA (pseudouridine1915-N3)-methyltransferase